MKKFLKPYLPLIILAVLACAYGVISYLPGVFSAGSLQYDSSDSAINKQYWEQEIARRGAEQAYAEFVEKNNLEPLQKQHFAAHVIGEVLYKKMGINGIAVCSDDFGFGCYHGFATLAIAEGGKDALMALDTACADIYGPLSGCQHGLGHGVMEYVGYQHIEEALRMCKELVYQPTPLLGCTSGVFMEYLSPLAGVAENLQPEARLFDEKNPYMPCTDVSEEFRASCYFELGQWLRQTQNVNYGLVCEGSPDAYRHDCFMGIGTDLTRGWNDTETLLSKCGRYAPKDELACRAGAAWQLVGGKVARTLCAYADDTLKEECMSAADLTQGLDVSIKESLQ